MGHLIVVYSSQGGAGCTTIATHLALGLLKENAKVLLADMRLQLGDVAVALNLKGSSTVADLLTSSWFDEILFEDALVSHESGLKVLLAPYHYYTGTDLTKLHPLIHEFETNFDLVVADTGNQIDDLNTSLFDQAALIIV